MIESYQTRQATVEYLLVQSVKRCKKILHLISTQIYWIARHAVSTAFIDLAPLSAKITFLNLSLQTECEWSADWASRQKMYSASTARLIRSELAGLGLYRVVSLGKGKSRSITRLVDIDLMGLLGLARLLMIRILESGGWDEIPPHRYGFLSRVFGVVFPGISLYSDAEDAIALDPEVIDPKKEGSRDCDRMKSQVMRAEAAAVDCRMLPTLAQVCLDLAKSLGRKLLFLEERQKYFDLPF